MSNSSDLTIKYAKIGGHRICIVFCEGMTSTDTMAELIFQPLNTLTAEMPFESFVRTIEDGLIIAGEQKQADTYSDICENIMSGFVAILVDGLDHAITVGVQGYASRSVEPPSTHSNVRSSRDGFVEVVRTNVSLVRRRMKNTDLVFKMMTLGDMSNTDVCLCYIKNVADKKLVKEVEKRLKQIPLNTILEGGFVQPFLENPGSQLFSEVGATERPDVLTAKLHEGKVGVLIDGTPFALFVPKLFMENFSVIDDYTGRPIFAAFIRIIRYMAIIFATVVSGFYVALANFNPELFPEALLLNLATSIQDTPYPLLPECLLIHVFYEIMREAGLRIPTNIGHAVSIVGGLVIGDIVVSAGLVGAPMVLMVAMALGTVGCNGSKDSGAASDSGTEAAADVSREGGELGEGSTQFSLTVTDKDGNETQFEIHTDKETVGEALLELNLIAGDESEYGLFVKTVNGITADYDTDGVYWAFYVNGEYASAGVDATPVTEGDSYALKVE